MHTTTTYHSVRTSYSLPVIWRANLVWLVCLTFALIVAAGPAAPGDWIGVAAGVMVIAIAPLIAAIDAASAGNPLIWTSMVLAHAGILWVALVAMCQVISPARHFYQEAALPISPPEKWQADLILLIAAALPLLLLYGLGTAGLIYFATPKFTFNKIVLMILTLLASIAASLLATLSYLQYRRTRFNGAASRAQGASPTLFEKTPLLPNSSFAAPSMALIAAPILRGVAPQTRQWCLGLLGSCALVLVMAWRFSDYLSYFLAALSLLLFSSVRLIRLSIETELAPKHRVLTYLPLDQKKLAHQRAGLTIILIGLCLLASLASLAPLPEIKNHVLIFYALLTFALCSIQAIVVTKETGDATLGWFVSLAVCIAVGSLAIK
jgi:hypothetical protein